MTQFIFIIISFLLGLFSIRYIRSYDKYEKEPLLTMLAVVCWGGVWSILIASLLYFGAVRFLGTTEFNNAFGALFVIGPVEESAKLLAFISAYFLFRKKMNEPVDGMIYMSCVALGFSLIENYLYATANNAGYLLFLRLGLCTPLHILCSAFMGLSFYLWLRNRKAVGLLFIPFIFASVVHGAYDLIIFNGMTLVVLIFFMKMLFGCTMDLLSYATAQSIYRKTLKEFINTYSDPVFEDGIECLQCGSKMPKLTYRLNKIIIQKCQGCEHYLTTKNSLFYIFHHFAATFRDLSNRYLSSEIKKTRYSTLIKSNYISETKQIAFFSLDELDLALEELNTCNISRTENKWWFPEMKDRPLNQRKTAIDGAHAFLRWFIYPFSSEKQKALYILPTKKPAWNWGSFIIPELWFLYHEIWGVFFLLSAFYVCLIYLAVSGPYTLFSIHSLIIIFAARLLSGRYGNNIYYARHGKWPIASWNETRKLASKDF